MTTPTASTLDVRTLPPVDRHRLIFAQLDGLAERQAIALVNDHDPVPLLQQIERLRPGAFGVIYLERGPAIWRLEIARLAPAARAEAGSCCSGGACCG